MNAHAPRVLISDLTGRAYYVPRYRTARDGAITSISEKTDVTTDVVHHLMAAAWLRGWNDHQQTAAGETMPNPYRDGA